MLYITYRVVEYAFQWISTLVQYYNLTKLFISSFLLQAKEIELQELDAILQSGNIKESLRGYKEMLLDVIWV